MPSIWTLLRQHYSPSLLRLVLHVWLLYSAVTLVFMRSIIGIVQGGVGVLASIETLRAIKSPKVVGLFAFYSFTNAIISLALALVMVSGFYVFCYRAENVDLCESLSDLHGILLLVGSSAGGLLISVIASLAYLHLGGQRPQQAV